MTETTWREALSASPLSWPIAGAASRLPTGQGIPAVEAIDLALGPLAGLRFVPPTPRPRGRRAKVPPDALYDARIARCSEVPTRPGNLHDLMNALVWSRFPLAKRAVHARQDRLVRARVDPSGRRLVPHRTAEEDALAMLDEGGLVLLVLPPAADRVREATLRRDVWALEQAASSQELLGALFGHALYEHLARREGRTVWGKAVLFPTPDLDVSLSDVDAWLAGCLAAGPVPGEDCGSAPVVPSVLRSRR